MRRRFVNLRGTDETKALLHKGLQVPIMLNWEVEMPLTMHSALSGKKHHILDMLKSRTATD